jgi:hypothetical protein
MQVSAHAWRSTCSLIRPRLTYANVISTLALFVALGGGAFAATKFVGPGSVVRLCVSPGGAVRVLKVGEKCGRGKTEVPVDQTGPQGVPGPRGQTGSQGPPGPQGNGANYTAGTGLSLNGTAFSANLSQLQARVGACASDQVLQSVDPAGSPTCIGVHAYSAQGGNGSLTAAVALPAGNWVVIGEETVSINATGGGTLVCNINQNGNSIGHASQTAGNAAPQSVSPVALATTTGANTAIQLVCDTGGASTFTPGAAIYAIPVAAVN